MTTQQDKLGEKGTSHHFQTTHWSHIVKVRTLNPQHRKQALDILIRRYWRPVYGFLRRKGINDEQAQDLTQSFFHEVVLEGELFQKAESAKGRFRTFLLTALDRYVAGQFRKDAALKRNPAGGLTVLQLKEIENMATVQTTASAEQVFNYTWAVDLLEVVIADLEKEYAESERKVYWQVFYDRILEPILSDTSAPTLETLCAKYDIESQKKISNMMTTVKRRFRRALLDALEETLPPDADPQEELLELIAIFSSGRAE